MLIFLIVLIGLSLLILGHEAGHFVAAKRFGLKVDEFGIGFPPRLKAFKKGETEYSVNWLPFGGFVKIAGENDQFDEDRGIEAPAGDRSRLFSSQPVWKRAIITAAGIVFNFVAGWLLLAVIFMIGTPSVLLVRDTVSDSPAAAAGLMSGDVIRGFKSAERKDGTVPFSVVRNGEELSFEVKPVLEGEAVRIGVMLEEGGAPRLGFFSAIKESFLAALRIAKMTVMAFGQLAKGLFSEGKLIEGVVGPVGIFGVAQDAGGFGLIYLFQLLALISVNLAVANLIPFPALDGGRLLLLLVEKLKGSPVPKKVEAVLNVAGFALLILLMVLVTVRDVGRIVG